MLGWDSISNDTLHQVQNEGETLTMMTLRQR